MLFMNRGGIHWAMKTHKITTLRIGNLLKNMPITEVMQNLTPELTGEVNLLRCRIQRLTGYGSLTVVRIRIPISPTLIYLLYH